MQPNLAPPRKDLRFKLFKTETINNCCSPSSRPAHIIEGPQGQDGPFEIAKTPPNPPCGPAGKRGEYFPAIWAAAVSVRDE